MPELSETTEQVEKYLYSRGIHPVIIRYCLDNRLLFESADFHNAVFVGYDKDGKARYGALRSTVSSYKGELTGSDKHFSFFLEGKPNAEHIHVFESAIDLLSFATLTLLAGRDWKSETYLSLRRRQPLSESSDDFGSRWENVTEQGKITEPDLNPGF